MRTRPVLAAVLAAFAVVAAPAAAQAKTTETLDKRIFDSAAEVSAGSWHLEGASAGDLGYYLDLTVTAADGTLPTASNTCEPVGVNAVLTLPDGGRLTVTTTGEACAPFGGGTPAVNAYFGTRQVTYDGSAHKKVRVLGDGLIAAGGSWLGYQANLSATVAW